MNAKHKTPSKNQSLILERFMNSTSFPKHREEISKLAYSNFVNQIRTKPFHSGLKSLRELTGKEEEKQSCGQFNGDKRQHCDLDRNEHQQSPLSMSQSLPLKKGSLRNRNTLDSLIAQCVPVILKSLSFIRSDNSHSLVFIRNKYAELFN